MNTESSALGPYDPPSYQRPRIWPPSDIKPMLLSIVRNVTIVKKQTCKHLTCLALWKELYISSDKYNLKRKMCIILCVVRPNSKHLTSNCFLSSCWSWANVWKRWLSGLKSLGRRWIMRNTAFPSLGYCIVSEGKYSF